MALIHLCKSLLILSLVILSVLAVPYSDWMTRVSDSAPWEDLVIPGSHNTHAINCKLGGLIPQSYLTCQQDWIYNQLMGGTRSFDLRLIPDFFDDSYSFGHGICQCEVPMVDGLTELARFVQDHPTEIIQIRLSKSNSTLSYDDATLASNIEKILQPDVHAFKPTTTNLQTATMADMRAAGKQLIMRGEWVSDEYKMMGTDSGTWSSDYNFGPLDQGQALYDHIYDLLDTTQSRLSLDLNRASGDSLNKTAPLDYMLHDYQLHAQLVDHLANTPEHLKWCTGLTFDHVTYDEVQVPAIVELNVAKGLIS